MWYPAKAAFRAGSANTEWDDANIGLRSTAMGANTTASVNQIAAEIQRSLLVGSSDSSDEKAAGQLGFFGDADNRRVNSSI